MSRSAQGVESMVRIARFARPRNDATINRRIGKLCFDIRTESSCIQNKLRVSQSDLEKSCKLAYLDKVLMTNIRSYKVVSSQPAQSEWLISIELSLFNCPFLPSSHFCLLCLRRQSAIVKWELP